jgi:hypothetical protein
MNEAYTFACAGVNSGISEALAILRDAEQVEGANVQMLSEWLNQFDIEMQRFNEIAQQWKDEIDNAGPVKPFSVKVEAADVPELD